MTLPRLTAVSLLATATLGTPPSVAVASQWTEAGIDVSRAPGDQYAVALASDREAGVYITWMDSAEGTDSTDVRVQRIGTDGAPSPGWPAGGLDLTPVPGEQFVSALASTPAGVYTVWDDGRRSRDLDVYGTLVAPNGVVDAAWPTSGTRLTGDDVAIRSGAYLATDPTGALVAWKTFGPEGSEGSVSVQRLADAQSHPGLWKAPTTLDSDLTTFSWLEGIVPDGEGGAVVVWTSERELSPVQVRAHHVDANGDLDSRYPAIGTLIGGGLVSHRSQALAPVSGGGSFVAWRENVDFLGETCQVRVYRLAPDASPHLDWPEIGVAIASGVTYSQPVQIAATSDGGCLVARLGLPQQESGGLFVAQLDPEGRPTWGLGRRVSDVTPLEHHLASDQGVGCFVVWSEGTVDASQLYAQRLDRNGDPAQFWSQRGVPLAPPGANLLTAIEPDGAGGVYVLWSENRGPDTYNDVRLQRVLWDGQLASSVPDPVASCTDAGLRIFPNPMRVSARICLGPEVTSPSALAIFDASGRTVRSWGSSSGALDTRVGTLAWDGKDDTGHDVASGVYWIRAESPLGSARQRIIVTR